MRRAAENAVLVALAVPAFCLLSRTGVAGPVAAAPALVAAAAALRLRPLWLMVAAPVFSLVVDFAYRGDQDWVALWGLLEGPALLVQLIRVVRRAPARQASWISALIGVAVLVLPLRLVLAGHKPLAGWAVASTPLLMLAGACAGVGLYLRAQDAQRGRAVAEARRDQRLALAHDLHDFVAHEITAIVLEAQAALLSTAGDRAAFAAIEEAGQRALSSMDQTVHALRTPAADVLADIEAVAARFTAGGMRARVETEGLPPRLPDGVGEAAYRVVMEALTNVRRHAPGAKNVVIALSVAAGVLTVRITDDGIGAGGSGGLSPARAAGGTGLGVLRAYVVREKGNLIFGFADGGWEVRADLPFGR